MEWPFGKEEYSKEKFLDNGIQFSAPIENINIKSKRKPEFLFKKDITPDPEINSILIANNKLVSVGYKISDSAKEMLQELNWKEKPKNPYKIVSISVNELFDDDKFHTYWEIITKAKEDYGLELVPPTLVTEICLNYKKDKDRVIATKAIETKYSTLLFTCGLNTFDNNLWLGQIGGSNNFKFNPDEEFLFVRK